MAIKSLFPKLSICITTLNRADFIGATLDSILSQLTNECEVVVLDAASTDQTEIVMVEYARRDARVRYVRQDKNNGVDRDYDRAVELARGEYCWLMTDDDLFKSDAIASVLTLLRRNLSAVLVNAEIMDISLSKVLLNRWLDFESDRMYRPEEMDRLFVDVVNFMKYIGGVVIKREVWLARSRERYYGSWFIHVGVIFQGRLPEEVEVIAKPLITIRWGNSHTFSPKVVEILFFSWPSIGDEVAPSASARRAVHSLEPWRHFRYLLEMRSLGYYSLTEYKRWFRPRLRSIRGKIVPRLAASVPGSLANALFLLYYSITEDHLRDLRLHDLRRSRFHIRNRGSAEPVW